MMRSMVSGMALLAALGVASSAHAGVQGVPAVPAECGYQSDAPIVGLGVAAGADATPIMAELEKRIAQRGDKSSQLRSVRVPAMRVDGSLDYAMMRLSQAAGRPIWVMTESGSPGPAVSMDVPETTLGEAFDRLVAGRGVRWRFDGDKVYLLGGREWTIAMPANRDMEIAVSNAISASGGGARVEGSTIRFYADDEGAARVSEIVRGVYSQPRLNPFDVQFFRVYPTHGAIDWSALAARTNSVQSVSFEGKAATVVLEPSAAAVVDAFLAREGGVRVLGAITMVAPATDATSVHVAGCGAAAEAARTLELGGGHYAKGVMPVRYGIRGGEQSLAGSVAVAPGSIVVLADGEPKDGAYVVAVVRPRVLQLQLPPARP